MSFINSYKNPDFVLQYATEVQENKLNFIYSVGEIKGRGHIIKTRKNGSTIWQKTFALGKLPVTFQKIVQIATGKSLMYVISATDGFKPYLFAIDSNGNLLWTRLVEVQTETVRIFIEPVTGTNECYVCFTDKLPNGKFPNPVVLKVDEFGNISAQVQLESGLTDSTITIKAIRAHNTGLAIAGDLVVGTSRGIILDVTANLTTAASRMIDSPEVVLHDILVNAPADYTISGADQKSGLVFISRISAQTPFIFHLPKTEGGQTLLAAGKKYTYLAVNQKENGILHAFTGSFTPEWSKYLAVNKLRQLIRSLTFFKKSDFLTVTAGFGVELAHTNSNFESCITEVDSIPRLSEIPLKLADDKLRLSKPGLVLKAMEALEIKDPSTIAVICKSEDPCVKDERLCALYEQLLAIMNECAPKVDPKNYAILVPCAEKILQLVQQFDKSQKQYNLQGALASEINAIKAFIRNPNAETYPAGVRGLQTLLAYIYELGNCACVKDEFNLTKNALVQSPHFYLQAAGSLGNDSTKGMHLRWLLKGALSKHLPKADYATPGINFNKAADYVKIYRTPYVENKVTLDFSIAPNTVNDVAFTWLYVVGSETFYIYFHNGVKYTSVRNTTNPSTNPLDFIKNYGNEIIEIEHKTKTSFAVTPYFNLISTTNTIRFELLSVEEMTITAPKRVTMRQTHTLANISGIKQLSENIRAVRLRTNLAFVTKLEFEFYADFIASASLKKVWTFIGSHALTKDTAIAYNRLEPQPGSVHGNWLRFNDDAYVNVDNYKTRWNSPSLDPQNRILDTVDRYISLSDTAANPIANELIYFNDPSATPIPGYEPDPDFDPSENQFELSNLYVLQLASMDYHVARMLGLGVLDLNPVVMSGKYIYLAEYITFGDLEDGSGAREVQHVYCSLPTELSDERLPIPIDLQEPVPGIFQDLGTEAPSPLTDANGYSQDGHARFISLFPEALPEEAENSTFYQSNTLFVSANATIPVYAGIEYRSSSVSDWQKPELSYDRTYFNIDTTVAPEYTNETRAIVLPEPGYPLFVHREKQNGWHDYSSYGINWFSRATASPVIHSIETVIVPTNLLVPPTNISAVLIRNESPLLLTSALEQVMYSGITTADKTFIRLTFDYNHGQEIIDYHKAINGEIVSGYSQLPDNEELFAEDIEIFFRNEIPNSVSGKILSVTDDSNPLLSVITTDEYVLASMGASSDNTIVPMIPTGLEANFVGSALTVDGETYIVHLVDNTGTYPQFTIFKNDANGVPVTLSSSPALSSLTAPSAGGLFICIENMLSTGSWHVPGPLSFKVNIDLDTIYNETIDVHIPDGTIETHVQKFRGLYENALIEKVLEDHDGDELDGTDPSDTPQIHLGMYKMTFTGVNLPEHSQNLGSPHSVNWYKGVVRIHSDAQPNGPRKELQVVRTENIGTTDDLIIYAVDGSFDAADPNYDQVSIGVQLVNYYPGYKVYLHEDVTYGLTETAILPGTNEDVRYSIFGLRSHDVALGFVSKISQPVLMFAQKIEEPLAPRQSEGGLYATRPDFFGKASYTFTTEFDHKPHAMQFGRASDVQILTALWRNDQPMDPLIWTVQRIQDEIFDRGEAVWYNERWHNLLGFDYTYPSDTPNDGLFERFPDSTGTSLPLPNKQEFIDAINAFVTQHNADFGTSIPPISAITSLYQIVIPTSSVNTELKIVDFVRDVVHNCFVPLTEIPVVYQYIKGNSYTPIPKKQVIRDERGDLLKPTDPEFDMAPMMKEVSTNKTQFTDFGIDGASNAKYFYISREFNLQMKAGPYSPILGPINLVNALPPKAPEIIKVTPILENRAFNIAPAIELKINAYLPHQHISKISIYRATSMQDALSVRTMKQLPEIDIVNAGISGEVWSVKDDFSDLGYVPFGDPLFYVMTVSRELHYVDRDQLPVTEWQPSEPSKLTVTNIVENYNPESPSLSYTSDPLNVQNELENVILSWNKTAYNGKYHLYKRNEQGNWNKIGEVISNATTLSLTLTDTTLASGTLAKTNADGNTIYHAFKVVAENFVGMLSREEKILSI